MRYFPPNVRTRFRRKPHPTDEKPYRVTLHAPGDQWQTFQMGEGDGVGLGKIRVDVKADGIHVSPIPNENEENYRRWLERHHEQARKLKPV